MTSSTVLPIASFLILLPLLAYGQFPAVCNTQENLNSKTCCPANCGGLTRGSCVNITQEAIGQWESANSTIVEILRNAPNTPQKGTADGRYLWPTVVFENVCNCSGNYGGYNCLECDFGWTGEDCQTRKIPVIRKNFNRLTETEKISFTEATQQLKNEMGVWSVIVEEPRNYSIGTVTLQNVTTYNLFIFLHDYIARDDSDACTRVNKDNIVDFAHEGPVFPVWHRRYMLIVQREFQRIMGNDSFGFPYWQWEENDRSPFSTEYYGVPSNSFNAPRQYINVTGDIFNEWYSICDLSFQQPNLNVCAPYWKPCNPANDLAAARPLQRGGGSAYLPNRVEVMIAIAAPSYDAANADGDFLLNDPRTSFRSRLEGWSRICSAGNCVGVRYPSQSHVHNVVHLWVGGQMSGVPAAINDPIFNMHHCNVDRILESWMRRFTGEIDILNSELLPAYTPVSGGHPGHNREDYIVPFFPLIKAGRQYAAAEEWGYTYDNLVAALIEDNTIADCNEKPFDCPICDADATCINCTSGQACPAPIIGPSQENLAVSDNPFLGIGLGLGLGLGIPLLLAFIAIVMMALIIKSKVKAGSKTDSNYQMTTVET